MKMTAPHKNESSGGKDDRDNLVAHAAKRNRDHMYQHLVEELGDQLSLQELDIHFTHIRFVTGPASKLPTPAGIC